jgi:NADPH:quinone reductase-like Zn-dependent oxidoreductase
MGRLRAGETMLVHSAAGAVGLSAIDLATIIGAKVIGVASAAKHDFLRRRVQGLIASASASPRPVSWADRGMISAATIAAPEKAGLEYILGVRERSTQEVRTEVIEDDGVAVPLLIPRQKGGTQLAIKETTLKGRHYVLCRNEEEARKDADRRAAILAGLDRKRAHGDKALVNNKGFRRFVKAIASGNFSIDDDKVEADAKFDGLFVLRTNTRLSALQVVLRYLAP